MSSVGMNELGAEWRSQFSEVRNYLEMGFNIVNFGLMWFVDNKKYRYWISPALSFKPLSITIIYARCPASASQKQAHIFCGININTCSLYELHLIVEVISQPEM